MGRPWLWVVALAACGGGSDGGGGNGPGTRFAPGNAAVIDVDDTTVYWSSGSNVYAQPKAGGAQVTLAPVSQLMLEDLAVDDTDVYWMTLNELGIYRTPKTTGGPEELVLMDTTNGYRGWFRIEGPTIYFTSAGASLYTAPLDGSAPPAELAPNARDVFVVTADAVFFAGEHGEIQRRDLPDGPVTVLASPLGEIVSAMAVEGNDVYWTGIQSDLQTYSLTRLCRVPVTGGTAPEILWQEDKNALHTGMAIDSDYVYWFHIDVDANPDDWQYLMHRLRRSDDHHEVFAGPWGHVAELAADATDLWVASRDGMAGGVWRVPKTPP